MLSGNSQTQLWLSLLTMLPQLGRERFHPETAGAGAEQENVCRGLSAAPLDTAGRPLPSVCSQAQMV